MAVNKVELANGEVLVDLTNDSVTPNTLVKGTTAHDKSGNLIEGTYGGDTYYLNIYDLDEIGEGKLKLTDDIVEFLGRLHMGERVFLKVRDGGGWYDTYLNEDRINYFYVYRTVIDIFDVLFTEASILSFDITRSEEDGWYVCNIDRSISVRQVFADNYYSKNEIDNKFAEYGTPEEISAIFDVIYSQIEGIQTTLSNLGIAEEGSY